MDRDKCKEAEVGNCHLHQLQEYDQLSNRWGQNHSGAKELAALYTTGL